MAVDLYGATLQDVDGLLIWDVETSSNPTPQQVQGWLEVGASDLFGLVGEIPGDGPCGGEQWHTRARFVVALFAAAMAEDAHFPERARRRKEGEYGAVLWERHKERMASLQADIEKCRDAAGTTQGGAAHSFPTCPLVTRTMPS